MATQSIEVPPVRQRLRSRPLSANDDRALVTTVRIGTEPWEQEVQDFLRDGRAIQHEEKGNCATTLFLLPDEEVVVGFISLSHKTLLADKEFKTKFSISNKLAPMKDVDAVFITAFGVDERYRSGGQGYGTEIYSRFVDEVRTGMQRPRFIYLEVWEDSPAVRLYARLGFRSIGVRTEDRYGADVNRLLLVADRFQKPDA